MKIKSLQTFHLKARAIIKKSGYRIDQTMLSSRFRLTGTKVRCFISYDGKPLEGLFACGDTPEMCLSDLKTQLVRIEDKGSDPTPFTL